MARLLRAPDDELEQLLDTLDAIEIDAHDELDGATWTVEETSFHARPLPDDWGVAFAADASLVANMEALRTQVELRWRLDAVLLLTTVIGDVQEDRRTSKKLPRRLRGFNGSGPSTR
jgi:hypothetical protein